MISLNGDEFADPINRIEKNFIDTESNQEVLKNIQIPKMSNPVFSKNIISFQLAGKQPQFLGLKFLRILGISKFLSEEKVVTEKHLIKDIIIGLYGQKNPFVFLIEGKPNEISIYFGIKAISRDSTELSTMLEADLMSLETSFRGAYPGILLDETTSPELNQLYEFLSHADHIGLLTGIPTTKIGTEEFGVEQMERFIRGLYGQTWGFLVIADPMDDRVVLQTFDAILSEIRQIFPLIKENETRAAAGMQVTREKLNRSAQYYHELLEALLNQTKNGKIEGMWRITTFFFSPRRDVFDKMKILVKSTFSGEESFPEPIRSFKISEINPSTTSLLKTFSHCIIPSQQQERMGGLFSQPYTTVLTSRKLASLVSLPKEEMPGYDIKLNARYGVCIPPSLQVSTKDLPKRREINIGTVLDRGASTGNPLQIQENLFTKHGLVVGITGSGKTNTCFHLLLQLWRNLKIPFLVIEPTKGEYRNLIRDIPEMLVFTLGDETIAPFRMNPFEVPDGVHIQKHLDSLRAIFNASFVMYAPMPYVLENCLINVYEKKGWNLTLNTRGKTPTLEDLYDEIDIVVPRLGYYTEIASNVRAALRTRIRSLLLGGKGRMLNCETSISLGHILSHPTVLELKGIGDDEEKAFLMGLLFGRLHEYRESMQNMDRLQHILLIEEAHRLFANIISGQEESGHAKQKAVETLCNILTEIRVYGEGLLVVDQVPTKLAPDAIKNTNIKIIHRTIAGDDREVIAESIGLTNMQKRFLINLPRGSAVVFLEDTDEPFMVQIPDVKDAIAGIQVQQSDGTLRDEMKKRYYDVNPIPLRTTGPSPLCGCCDATCVYRLMMEPLAGDAQLVKNIQKIIDEKMGQDMLEGFRSLLLSSVRSLGYTTDGDPQIGQKLLCALVLCFNAMPKADPAHEAIRRKNNQIILDAFKERVTAGLS